MATLHVMAGKAGAGKTTLARRFGGELPAVVICEDEWMSQLSDPITNLNQYLVAARKIRSVTAPLTGDLLRLGLSVVFDFGGNTGVERRWTRTIADQAGADHIVHYVLADDEQCRARVRDRNVRQPAGVFFGIVTPEQVDEVNRFFSPPTDDEGLTVVTHDV